MISIFVFATYKKTFHDTVSLQTGKTSPLFPFTVATRMTIIPFLSFISKLYQYFYFYERPNQTKPLQPSSHSSAYFYKMPMMTSVQIILFSLMSNPFLSLESFKGLTFKGESQQTGENDKIYMGLFTMQSKQHRKSCILLWWYIHVCIPSSLYICPG